MTPVTVYRLTGDSGYGFCFGQFGPARHVCVDEPVPCPEKRARPAVEPIRTSTARPFGRLYVWSRGKFMHSNLLFLYRRVEWTWTIIFYIINLRADKVCLIPNITLATLISFISKKQLFVLLIVSQTPRYHTHIHRYTCNKQLFKHIFPRSIFPFSIWKNWHRKYVFEQLIASFVTCIFVYDMLLFGRLLTRQRVRVFKMWFLESSKLIQLASLLIENLHFN